jgi:hypothetical protein
MTGVGVSTALYLLRLALQIVAVVEESRNRRLYRSCISESTLADTDASSVASVAWWQGPIVQRAFPHGPVDAKLSCWPILVGVISR